MISLRCSFYHPFPYVLAKKIWESFFNVLIFRESFVHFNFCLMVIIEYKSNSQNDKTREPLGLSLNYVVIFSNFQMLSRSSARAKNFEFLLTVVIGQTPLPFFPHIATIQRLANFHFLYGNWIFFSRSHSME